MIDSLLLQPKVRQDLTATIQTKPHAILLVGLAGAGKQTVARSLAAHFLEIVGVEALVNEPYYKEISSAGQSIGIEAVRELQKFVTLKTVGTKEIRRVVCIVGAEAMTTEAQNALLKLLEEPPADTILILTADHQQHLLPTINSRLQAIQLLPPTKTEAAEYFASQGYDSAAIERAYLISNGQIGLMHALLSDNSEHPLIANIDQAKRLYGMKTFERLTMVDELSKQKDALPGLLLALKRISKTALDQAMRKDQVASVQSWTSRLEVIHNAEAALQKSANAKLVLTDLFLNL